MRPAGCAAEPHVIRHCVCRRVRYYVYGDLQSIFIGPNALRPITVAVRSKACVRGCSFAGIAGSNPYGAIDICLSLVSVLCCQVEVSASV